MELVPPGTADPIGAVIETLADTETLTGSTPRRHGRQAAMSEAEAAPAIEPKPEPWRRRIVRGLLYGKSDRNAKARARIGLAILAFTAVYGIIAGRLVILALTPDNHVARRSSATTRSRPRVPTFSTATAKSSRPT